MQPLHRVEGGEDCTFLPGRDKRGVLAREHDAAVDPAEVVIMRAARVVRPISGAAECEW